MNPVLKYQLNLFLVMILNRQKCSPIPLTNSTRILVKPALSLVFLYPPNTLKFTKYAIKATGYDKSNHGFSNDRGKE